MRILLLTIALCCQAAAWPPGPDTVSLSLPAEVKGEVGDWLTVSATTKGKVVRWLALDAGLKVFPAELLKDSKVAVVHAAQPGTYRLLAYTAIDGEATAPAVCVVNVGRVPNPPQPTPPTPTPSDPLAVELKSLFEADAAPHEAKRQVAVQLAALYRAAAACAEDRSLLTTGMFFDAVAARASSVPAGLKAVRARVAQEMKSLHGPDETLEFNQSRRVASATLLLKMAAIMEALP